MMSMWCTFYVMTLLSPDERAFAEAISGLAYCNPFLPERIAYERRALGSEFLETRAEWNIDIQSQGMHPNIDALRDRSERLGAAVRSRLEAGTKASIGELELYESLTMFLLFHRHLRSLQVAVERMAIDNEGQRERLSFYKEFLQDWSRLLDLPGVHIPNRLEPDHLFACFFQLRRAFHHIFTNIIGLSEPAVRLRASVWQSIFTHDMKRYRRALFSRMSDVTSLITGPSGTGKELVSRAIALSRYIPFDAKSLSFTEDVVGSFHPVNLSALSPTLIESELFGHRRGAFTGALQDREGWFEVCRPLGTVFLDEIGEVDTTIQVKLLRVLQTRTFQRLGDTQARRFEGKIIAATNREIAEEMRAGRFRQDLYYRLCSDMIRTPSLRERIVGNPNELESLTMFLATRMVGLEEAPGLCQEVMEYVARHLGQNYAWPGNVRELEQCVRNILIRGEYHPPAPAGEGDLCERLMRSIHDGRLSADDLLRCYCTLMYSRTRNYQETARRLGIDHRTVKSHIVPEWLER